MSHDWGILPVRSISFGDKEVILRPLAKSDEAALGDYFLGLSPQTRRVYAPHPFDRPTAESICTALGTPEGRSWLRLVAVADRVIIGYFIVYLGLLDSDRERRYEHLDARTACTLAPSVADAWQNCGLGSQLMTYAKECARALGKQIMVLMGGVREENPRAVHFYSKSGFRRVGEFVCTATWEGESKVINNFDMLVDL
jgi:GNAT superfamily N-acetyltransferase